MFDKKIHLFSLKIYPNFLSETSPYCMNSIQRKIYLIYMLPLMTQTHLLLQVLNMNNEKIEKSYTITIFSYRYVA